MGEMKASTNAKPAPAAPLRALNNTNNNNKITRKGLNNNNNNNNNEEIIFPKQATPTSQLLLELLLQLLSNTALLHPLYRARIPKDLALRIC
jgi:hypothetical protein